MPSAWIHRRATKKKGTRYRVEYRLGGSESAIRYAGTFATKREALDRRAWVLGELAAMRVPDVRLVEPKSVETFEMVAEAWRRSRISVSEGTRLTHKTNVDRLVKLLGAKTPAEIRKADVAGVVEQLRQDGKARESIRKTISTLAMVLDFADVVPNPARGGVELPEKVIEEMRPPTAADLELLLRALPAADVLPTLVLDATGMRVGELEALRWGDVDETKQRWLVSAARSKTRRGRWVNVPPVLFAAIVGDENPRVRRGHLAAVGRDRPSEGQVFDGFGADRYRTTLARACKAAGTLHFHPHDLRHRRASLWHLGGVSAAEAAGWLGHSAQEHLRTYAHVMLDRQELDYAAILSRCASGAGPSAGLVKEIR